MTSLSDRLVGELIVPGDPGYAGMWPGPADNEANTRWVRDFYAALAPHSDAGGYINFASADDQQRVRDNFGSGYDRLAQIKRTYDPANLFRLNQNITPAASASTLRPASVASGQSEGG